MNVDVDCLPQRLKPLKSHRPRSLAADRLRGSAVLIPIVRGEREKLFYTLRCRDLKHHPGQISFPGGRIEPGETPSEAALREAEEEIGLPPGKVTMLGRLNDVVSPKGFHIRCYVGLAETFEPKLNRSEVERLITVDLDELFDPRLHSIRKWKGFFDVHYFDFKDGMVWGVTGKITYHLREVLRDR